MLDEVHIGVDAQNSVPTKRGAEWMCIRHCALARFRSWYGLNLPQASLSNTPFPEPIFGSCILVSRNL